MKKGGRERVKVGVCEGEGSGLREWIKGGREGWRIYATVGFYEKGTERK